jgi:hypothetical protein
MAMEFPNLNTRYCEDFVGDIKELPAIDGVEVV